MGMKFYKTTCFLRFSGNSWAFVFVTIFAQRRSLIGRNKDQEIDAAGRSVKLLYARL